MGAGTWSWAELGSGRPEFGSAPPLAGYVSWDKSVTLSEP